MKFAIRKLALTCILPAALFQGTLPTDAVAQMAPSAVSKANSGLPARRATPTSNSASKTKAAGQQAEGVSLATEAPKPGTFAAGSQTVKPTLVRQVTNGRPQQQQPTNGGESDVQRQLRMLYEKSGQEMPAMTLEEMEVPEPQAGVRPSGPGQDEGDDGVMVPGQQYSQPEVPPQKAPNFFERVFLGKKMPPPPVPRQMPQRPQPYATGQMRPGQTYPAMPQNGGQPRPNYRPYQPAQPVQAGQPVQGGQPVQSGQQLPPGYPAQRPGMMTPQGVVQQPVQPRPPVIPPQAPPQSQLPPQAQQPVVQQPQVQQPQVQQAPVQQPGNQPANGTADTQQNKPSTPPAGNEIPLLEEEPEESLEIDIKPQPQPAATSNASAAPTVTPGNVAPPAAAAATLVAPGENPPADSAAPAGTSVEANPFSGLQLSVPESTGPNPTATGAANSTPPTAPPPAAATPSATTPSTTAPSAANATTPAPVANKSPAANATQSPLPTLTAPADEEEVVEEDPFAAEPAAPPAKASPPPAAPAATPKTTVAPNRPATAVQVTKPAATTAVKGPAQVSTVKAPAEKTESKAAPADNLKKLSEAPEKDGLKGFCPVVLRQKRQLIEAKPQFKATFAGKKYHFSSNDAKTTFEKSPQLFAPAHAMQDAVALLDDDKSLMGTLDHAAWFQGRLYLFANAQNLETFKADPEQYLDDEDSEDPAITLTGSTADKAKTAAPAGQTPATQVTARPAAPSSAQPSKPTAPPAFDDLPILSDNLDALVPIAPRAEPAVMPKPVLKTPATTSNVPKKIEPAKGTPARETPIKESPKSEAPKALTPKNVVPKTLVPQGPKLGARVIPNTQRDAGTALISMPPQTTTPRPEPRPISADLLRIVPPAVNSK